MIFAVIKEIFERVSWNKNRSNIKGRHYCFYFLHLIGWEGGASFKNQWITERRKPKPVKSRITFVTQLKIAALVSMAQAYLEHTYIYIPGARTRHIIFPCSYHHKCRLYYWELPQSHGRSHLGYAITSITYYPALLPNILKDHSSPHWAVIGNSGCRCKPSTNLTCIFS